MKKKIVRYLAIVCAGLAFALFSYNIIIQSQNDPPVYDDEQEGLKEQIKIYFSHVVAEDTPKGLAAQRFADLVEEKTKGRVKVIVFPNGSLYSDKDEIEALRKGKVQMIAPSYSNVAKLVPEWEVLDLPFIFQNDDNVERVLTGKIGEELLSMLEPKGFKGLAFWGNGFKQMVNSQMFMKNPDDFKDQRFRIMPNKVIKKQFNMLGAEPIALSFDQVYESLEEEAFDGQENTISNIYSKRFYQFHPYVTISNHGYLGYVVMVNETFWNQLPKDVQKQIMKAIEETTAWNMKQSKQQNIRQLEEMRQNPNIHIHTLTEKERKKWQERFVPLYQEYEAKYGKLLKEIRNAAS
ncbi:DctP family TRAP transporter solute-binding subunit [Aeribacillus sp. FSL K6-2848]|uniref:DctP family TRAP transporter solute-binding subunit n=1 Tax=unclassified Aeribacillus TaxID=2640495 RepID=UPI0030D57EE6